MSTSRPGTRILACASLILAPRAPIVGSAGARLASLSGWKAEQALAGFAGSTRRLTDRGRQGPPGAVPAFKRLKKLGKCGKKLKRFSANEKGWAAQERAKQKKKPEFHSCSTAAGKIK